MGVLCLPGSGLVILLKGGFMVVPSVSTRWLGVMCGLIFGLVGCQGVPSKPASNWRSHQAEVSQIKRWDMAGKFSFHKDKTVMGSFKWHQHDEQYDFDFTGPMHVGSAMLTGDAGRATFKQGDQAPVVGASPEALLLKHMGWQVPLQPLRYWIVGAYVPDQRALVRWDDQHHLRIIHQDGWQVLLSDYKLEQGVMLPHRLSLKRGEVWAKLVVQSWQPQRGGSLSTPRH
jgi:outer membrane lipoprotein LolB